jgi:formylglycine-generating enzyme required for sulfatase activity
MLSICAVTVLALLPAGCAPADWLRSEQDPTPAKPAASAAAPAAKAEEFKAYEETMPKRELKFAMVPVPGGKFTMGSPADEKGRSEVEGPQVEVQIAPFWMGRCEVTWEEYDCWNTDFDVPQSKKPDGMSRPTPAYTDMTFGMGREGGFPAISMTNEAAREYCRWLSKKTGRFYRLPTEAEWEYACRAGSKTAYSFGDDPKKLADYAWFAGNADKAYHKVGLKQPNAFGLCDMHGNVAEWCADELIADFYAADKGGKAPRIDPFAQPRAKAGKPMRYPHVVRGGSWQDPPEMLRAAARRGSEPAWKQRDPQIPKSWWYFTDAQFVGFRVVRPLKEPSAEERAKFENP